MEVNSLVLRAVLDKLEHEMCRLYWNKNQKDYRSPFKNTGERYINDVFRVRSYRWNENPEEDKEFDYCNFVYKDLRVWWYKHSNNNIEWFYDDERDGLIPTEFLEQMLKECIQSVSDDWDTL